MDPLIHIGYHKTGTNWLQKVLFRNKEAGFLWRGKRTDSPVNRLVTTHPLDFDVEAAREDFDPDARRAAERGLRFVVSLERLSGHPFSGGYDSKELAHRLAGVFPEGRVLVVVREQRAMILSTYKQYVRAGGGLSLAHFLDPPGYRRPRVPHFDYRHFEYHRLVREYHRLFGDDRVLVLPYEQFRDEPRRFVEAIATFAGLELDDAVLDSLPYSETRNRARSVTAVRASRVVNRLFVRADVNPAPVLPSRRVAVLLGSCVRGLDRAVPAGLQARGERRLRAKVADAVGDRYAESNRVLEGLIGPDLEAYGYEVARAGSVDAEEEPLALG